MLINFHNYKLRITNISVRQHLIIKQFLCMVCLVECWPVVWKVFNHRSVRCEWFGAVPHFLFSTRDNISPIITILTWCYTRIQNIVTSWCLWEATTVTQQAVTSYAAQDLLRLFLLMVSIFWCATSMSEQHLKLTGIG